MAKARPLKIGISACFFHADPQRAIFKGKTLLYVEQSLAHWVMSEPNVLGYLIPALEPRQPSQAKATLAQLVKELDGLVLQGGSDVSPRSYGEAPQRPEWQGDFVRDQYEAALVKEFLQQGKPVIGVCRGLQLVNVALGGTLHQDIPNHRNWDIYDQNFHDVAFEPGTKLAKLYGKKLRARVNSIHHQAIKELAPGLAIEARSEKDGVIEAVRLVDARAGAKALGLKKLPGKPYLVAVQWHPEFHDPKDAALMDTKPLLHEFLGEARRRK